MGVAHWPQFTIEEAEASRGWIVAQVTQLVSGTAPEPCSPRGTIWLLNSFASCSQFVLALEGL